MSKREESKYKINRRLGVNLWGRAKSPLNRRESRPGQHGENPAIPHHDDLVFQHDPGGFDGDYPAGGYDGVGRVHAGFPAPR